MSSEMLERLPSTIRHNEPHWVLTLGHTECWHWATLSVDTGPHWVLTLGVADKHKFSVIVGVGASKYRTDVVEDLFDNPVFNTECDMSVPAAAPPSSFLLSFPKCEKLEI